jgi:hypothetical protein
MWRLWVFPQRVMINNQEVLKLNLAPEDREPWLAYEDYLKGALFPLSHPSLPSTEDNYAGGRGVGVRASVTQDQC